MDFLRRKRKGKYNLFEEDSVCKKNDYKCKYEHCERARIQGRPLPSRPARISSGEYATVGSPRIYKKPVTLYEEPVPLYVAPKPLYGNVTMRRVSSPKEHIYEELDNETTAGGTRRRKHAVKSTHKKRGYGKRTMRKGGKRTMHKGGKRTMHKGGKRTMHKGGKRTMRKGGRKMMRGGDDDDDIYATVKVKKTVEEKKTECEDNGLSYDIINNKCFPKRVAPPLIHQKMGHTKEDIDNAFLNNDLDVDGNVGVDDESF
jgi:hypothetical protein